MPKWLKRQMSLGLAWHIPAGIGLRSDEGHPSAAPAAEGGNPDGEPAAQDPAEPLADDADKAPETDWKAEARKHEKRAKENAKAAEELAKVKASQMSEQEKAVAAAKAEGLAEAAKTYGSKLAAAEFKAAASAKGLNVADVSDLINVSSFIGEDGEVDSKAIKAAVDKLAKIAPAAAPGKSGAPIPGGSGGKPNTNPTLSSAVAARYGK